MAMIASARSQRAKMGYYEPEWPCLRKFNYSNGAGWKTHKKFSKSFKGEDPFKIRSKGRH